MEKKKYDIESKPSIVQEEFIPYERQEEHEAKRRREAILMSDMQKFKLFCLMLKRGVMFKNAKIVHKPFKD